MVQLLLELLENRSSPASLQPTAVEQSMLETINDYRADPAAYGLVGVAPSPPLAFNLNLQAAAEDHSQDEAANDFIGHTGSDGSTPSTRIQLQGYNSSSWQEALVASGGDANSALTAMLTATSTTQPLLLSQAVGLQQSEVGIGAVMNGFRYSNYFTVDMATGQPGPWQVKPNPFLTGAAFNDPANTGQYAIGNGVGGVGITAIGEGGATFSTTSMDAGGYQLQLAPGDYSIIAQNGSARIAENIKVGTDNVRLQFIEGQPNRDRW